MLELSRKSKTATYTRAAFSAPFGCAVRLDRVRACMRACVGLLCCASVGPGPYRRKFWYMVSVKKGVQGAIALQSVISTE
eukprot:6108289-Pyramimonas_sp.AAC.1